MHFKDLYDCTILTNLKLVRLRKKKFFMIGTSVEDLNSISLKLKFTKTNCKIAFEMTTSI